MAPIITLTTDFGAGSPYAAQMKGAILSINPEATIVDITHAVPPQDVRHGAIVLAEATGRFPHGTIHVAVVDPGVGTDRKIVFARFGPQSYIAPDNGLLSKLARSAEPSLLVDVTCREYWLPEVSATFHGRDIMAPAAAHVSLGVDPRRLGEPLDELVRLEWPAVRVEPGRIEGSVASIDSFGNLMTDITAEMLAEAATGSPAVVQCGARQVRGMVRAYGEARESSLVALVNSGGFLELAVVGGSAARALDVGVGERVTVNW